MTELLELVTEAHVSEEGFRTWHRALLQEAHQLTSRSWRLSRSRIRLKLSRAPSNEHPAPNAKLAYDEIGENWTVEINTPGEVGNANSLTGIARDKDGRLWLLRQGWLQPNAGTPQLVNGMDFQEAAGLPSVPVKVAAGPKDRLWYVVACLGDPPTEIRRQTVAFVERCSVARSRFSADPVERADAQAALILFGAPETGGTILKPAQPAKPESLVEKIQGDVSEALAARLAAVGKRLTKPRHAAGYEVDGVLNGAHGPVLIEIKSGVDAADVYAGVGQLFLYRKLLPSLANHQAVLLLPDQPPPALRDAVSEVKIVIETYTRTKHANDVTITFSPSFEALCGLPPG